MSTPDIFSLLGNYPPKTSTDRATLLDFARTTPLTYGSWKNFKQLYKLAEAPALAGEKPDVELLGILLGRIDAAPIPPVRQAILRLQTKTSESFNQQTVQGNGITYKVGGRFGYNSGSHDYDYDSSGWRLEVNNSAAQHANGGLRGLLASVKSALTSQATQDRRVYDFDSREFIGGNRKLSLDDQFLTIAINQPRQSNSYRINISDPSFIYLENSGPQAATWQYMKRRARRLLRKLSATQPALYRELLHAALRQSHATANQQPINPATQWLSMDALYGRSKSWKQVPASRGPYVRQEKKLEWRTRQENAPDAWNSDLHWIAQMLTDAALNPAANATALRVLQATGQPIPELNENQLQHFISSNEPVLQAHATRVVAAADDLNRWSPPILALALLHGGGKTRSRLQQFVQEKLSDIALTPSWKEAFTQHLSRTLAQGTVNRRTRTAANLLARLFADAVSDEVLFAHLGLFLANSREADAWIFERIRARGQRGDMKFLDEIALLPGQWRIKVLAEFADSSRHARPQAEEASALVTKDDATQNRIGWQFLEATAMEAAQIQELWKSFSTRFDSYAIYEAAFGEAASARLWQRAGWQPTEAHSLIDSRLQLWLQNMHYFGIDFFDAVLQSLPPEHQTTWIFITLARLNPTVAQQVLERHGSYASGYAPDVQMIRVAFVNLLLSWSVPAQNVNIEPVWTFLATSNVTRESLRELWRELWSPRAASIAFSDSAAELFRRAEIPADDVAQWAQIAPVHAFSPRFFLLIIESVPLAQKVDLLLRPSQEQWQGIRAGVLQLLRSDTNLNTNFWNAIWHGLESQPDLMARLDNELCATFNTLSSDAFATLLPSATPPHEAFVLPWLNIHEQKLLRDEQLETLILVASNPVAAIRLWGLRRVRERGLNVAIALRLMESGLPQPFALGREYFESAPRESQNERDYALALCDSPNAQVQQYGREFVQRRASSLLDEALLQNLLEHSDAQMQHWAADQVAQNAGVQTREFDAAVLRGRGRARKAKESVKRRLDQTTVESSALETGALLELARGNTVRDREWALQQLAKRALSGQEIEGIALKGKI